jgi:hypothetical protein
MLAVLSRDRRVGGVAASLKGIAEYRQTVLAG